MKNDTMLNLIYIQFYKGILRIVVLQFEEFVAALLLSLYVYP